MAAVAGALLLLSVTLSLAFVSTWRSPRIPLNPSIAFFRSGLSVGSGTALVATGRTASHAVGLAFTGKRAVSGFFGLPIPLPASADFTDSSFGPARTVVEFANPAKLAFFSSLIVSYTFVEPAL